MGVLNYFKPVSTWSPEKVRLFLKENSSEKYNLIDVRTPQEYEQGHLPGAQLIPVGELADRLSELDPKKTAVVYWAAGVRSRAAAATLSSAGFKEVYSMQGGINAWKGLIAKGAPESGFAYFSSAAKTEELIALAWWLESGSRQFYSDLAATMKDQEAKNLFKDLTAAEEDHQTSLLKLYQDLSGLTYESGFPGSVVPPEKEGAVMEGGLRVTEAIEWAKGKSVAEILEFSLSSEANSYDLYVKMERRMKDRRSAQVFHLLSGEEKQHLERLSALFQERI